MGRANPPVNHFSHPHDLHPILTPHQIPTTTLCSGCRLQSTGTMYTCLPCNFTLHQSCTTLPNLITHPSHPGCTLSLLTVASYPGGVFSCDACNRRGDGWSFHCKLCEYDIHVSCASKPLKIKHHAHGACDLDLTFKNPYVTANGFSCDVCRKFGSKQWLYRCGSCEFDVHLDCTNAMPQLQHYHSLPGASFLHQNNQLMHSASTGGIGSGQVYGSLPDMMMHSASMGNMQNNRGGGLGSSLMMAAAQGLVEGAFQGIGQAVVQEVIGGEGGDSAGGGDGSSY